MPTICALSPQSCYTGTQHSAQYGAQPGTTSIWYPTVMNSKTSPMQPQISDTYFSIISTPFLTTFPVFLAAFLAPFPAFLAPFFIFLPKPPFFFLLLLLLLSPLLLGLELSFLFLLLPLASSSSSPSSLSSLVSLTASRALELDILGRSRCYSTGLPQMTALRALQLDAI